MAIECYSDGDRINIVVPPRATSEFWAFAAIEILGALFLLLFFLALPVPFADKAFTGAIWLIGGFHFGSALVPQKETIVLTNEGLAIRRSRYNYFVRGSYGFSPLAAVRAFDMVEPRQVKPAPDTWRPYPFFLMSRSPLLVACGIAKRGKYLFPLNVFWARTARGSPEPRMADLLLALQATEKDKKAICRLLNHKLLALTNGTRAHPT